MKKRFVLVTTEHRGVFAGELAEHDRSKVTLINAKCAIYWNTKRGFLELAQVGPNAGSRISAPAASLILYGVTSIADVTTEAEAKWEKA